MTRFLVVLTDVRPLDGAVRNERLAPERRRQVVGASNREAADRIAGAFMALGMVRAGRQRVKVLAVGRRFAGEVTRVLREAPAGRAG
ncbi:MULTISPECIES: hypothetical protein [Micromonospora]|uniref:Uncharacterized protein n=1 Tax=Micromonospora yangpuensis TaxID=683228 RepID=A0A1C6UBA2_9ACTN|nr:hypothetical protein [Micromonospora yangpuensis]GGL86918.1 hypothetical protein GCM10012279_00770 [Micromonospora yangpuensis]SCL51302.1 hypothetical protein GA0070617_1740 [Micromonospora yangpuensis]